MGGRRRLGPHWIRSFPGQAHSGVCLPAWTAATEEGAPAALGTDNSAPPAPAHLAVNLALYSGI